MKKPNLLLISIDSLRADHLSAYGYAKETTPYLSELAEEGVLFNNAFSASNWTGAAVASLLTGRYPTSHGYTNQRYYLDADVPTLADQLQAAGYRTVCFSNNLYITPQTGLNRGFADYYYRGLGSVKAATASGSFDWTGAAVWNRFKQRIPLTAKTMVRDTADLLNRRKSLSRDDGAAATEQAIFHWLPQQPERPFFAYVHYQEPHSPYFPPNPYRKRFFSKGWLQQWDYLRFDPAPYYGGKKTFTASEMDNYQALYDGEIAYLDWRLGRLFDFLRQRNLIEQTMVIVTADHGECFGENGYIWHAFNLYESLVRVPLIVRFGEWSRRNETDDRLVQSVDILPTCLQAMGIDPELNDGVSFLHAPAREAVYIESDSATLMVKRWLEKGAGLQEEDFSQYLRDLCCYRTSDAKLIWTSDAQHEFYDLQQDPYEKKNLFGRDPRGNDFVRRLQKWRSRLQPHQANQAQPGFDKQTWEKLKTLGYA
ncbi:sulfatase [bacterium]|nr:sulfatase [bacterium]